MATVANLVATFTGDTSGLAAAVAQMAQMLSSIEQNTRKVSSTTETETRKIETHWQGISESIKRTTEMVIAFTLASVGLEGVGAILQQIKSAAIDMNAQVETSALQFELFSKNADWAKQHVADLFQFAKSTPFMTQPIIEASRLLEVFGGTALNTMANIRLIGDSAAKAGQDINQMSFWFTRMYASLRSGEPIGMAVLEMNRMGVLSADVTNKMIAMERAGASNADIWVVFKEGLHSADGAMDALAGTWRGVTTTFEDTKRIIIGEVMQPVFEALRNGLSTVNTFLSSREVEQWAKSMTANVSAVVAVLGALLGVAGRVGTTLAAMFGVKIELPDLEKTRQEATAAAKAQEELAKSTGDATDGMTNMSTINQALLGFQMPRTFESISTSARSMVDTFDGIGAAAGPLLNTAGAADHLRNVMKNAREDTLGLSASGIQRAFAIQPGFMEHPEIGQAYAATKAQYDSLEKVMVPMHQALTLQENSVKALALAMEPMNMAIKEQELVLKQAQLELIPYQQAVDAAQQDVNAFAYELIDAQHAITQATNALSDEKYAHIDLDRHLKDVTESLREQKVAHRDVQYALEDAKDMLASQTEALRPYAVSVENANNALERQKNLTEGVRIVIQPFKDSMDDARLRVDKVRDALSDATEKMNRFLNAPVAGDAAFRASTGAMQDHITQLQIQRERMTMFQMPGQPENPGAKMLDLQLQREQARLDIARQQHDLDRAGFERKKTEIEINATKGPEQTQDAILNGANSFVKPIWDMTAQMRNLTDAWVGMKEIWRGQEQVLLAAQRAERIPQRTADQATLAQKGQELGLLPAQQRVTDAQNAVSMLERQLRPAQRLIDDAQDAVDRLNNVTLRPLADDLEDMQNKLLKVNEAREPFLQTLEIAHADLDAMQWPIKTLNYELQLMQGELGPLQLAQEKATIELGHMRDGYQQVSDTASAAKESMEETMRIYNLLHVVNPLQQPGVDHTREGGKGDEQGGSPVSGVAADLKNMAGAINDMPDGLIKIAAGTTAVVTGFRILGPLIGPLIGSISGIGAVAGTSAEAVGVAGGTAGLAGVLAGLAIPIGIAVAAGAGLVVAYETNFADTQDAVNTLSKATGKVFEGDIPGFFEESNKGFRIWTDGFQKEIDKEGHDLTKSFRDDWGNRIVSWIADSVPNIAENISTFLDGLDTAVKSFDPTFAEKFAHWGLIMAGESTAGTLGWIEHEAIPKIAPGMLKFGLALGHAILEIPEILIIFTAKVGASIAKGILLGIVDGLKGVSMDLGEAVFSALKIPNMTREDLAYASRLSSADQDMVNSASAKYLQAAASPRASGGPASGWAMVGEQGPELVKLPYGSHVYPHGVIPAFSSGTPPGGFRGDMAGGLAGDAAQALASNSSPLVVQLDPVSLMAMYQRNQTLMNTPMSGSNIMSSQDLAQLQPVVTEVAASTAKSMQDIIDDWFKTWHQMINMPAYLTGSTSSYTPGDLKTPITGMQSPNYYLMEEQKRYGGYGASAPENFTNGRPGGGMQTDQYGRPNINTTVNVGVNVGNNRELAELVGKETNHAYQQAAKAG